MAYHGQQVSSGYVVPFSDTTQMSPALHESISGPVAPPFTSLGIVLRAKF